MVTFPIEQFHSNKVYREGHCTHYDTKPTNDPTMMNGSKLIEMDTGKIYIYDDTNHVWNLFNHDFESSNEPSNEPVIDN